MFFTCKRYQALLLALLFMGGLYSVEELDFFGEEETFSEDCVDMELDALWLEEQGSLGKNLFEDLISSSTLPPSYAHNSFVPIDLWNQLQPFFLPDHHPEKKKLDRIFSKRRITQNPKTFEAAGFGSYKRAQPYKIIFGKSSRFPEIILKVYLDSQPPLHEWLHWLQRIEGASLIRECLDRHQFTRFEVPQKWIYPLPEAPSPPIGPLYSRKNFILVAEDMHVLGREANKRYYRHKMTKELLDMIYIIVDELGLNDAIFASNMSFTEKNTLAFVDTENFHRWPINYGRIKKYLSHSLQEYWQQVIDNGGPQRDLYK